MIPNEMEIINKFKAEFPTFIQKTITKHPFNFKLRKYKKWALNQINNLSFVEYNSAKEDQIYDATIMCIFEDFQVNCPISININKLVNKVKHTPPVEANTANLYDLVHPDVKNELFLANASQICPPILLYDDCFDHQLIDGNHRVVNNYRIGQSTTKIIVVNSNDLKNCLEFNDFEIIIKIFTELNKILNRYN